MFGLIFMAEVIAFIAWCVISSRRKKAAEADETDINDDFQEEKKNHKAVRTLIAVLCWVIMLFTGCTALMEKAIIREKWTTFNSERIEKIESTSDIKIDNHVKLKKYVEKFGGPDGPLHVIEFECDLDMFEFAEKNCGGYIESYAKDGEFYCINYEKEKTEGIKELEFCYEYDGKYEDKFDEYYVIRGEYHNFTIYKKGDIYVHNYPNWRQMHMQPTT